MGNQITGEGGPTFSLSPERMASILRDGLGTVGRGSRVLAIIPDKTRDDNTNLLFPIASKLLFDRGIETLDVLVAQGTHPPMSDQEKSEKIGNGSGADFITPGRIFDHRWNTESELVQLGTIEAERVSELSSGLLTEAIPVRLNRLLTPGLYDTVLILGATVPHEVAGFAGGMKYFFPGVAGPDLTHKTHWLGALASIENVIGRVETPTRHLIEAAGDFVQANVVSINSVVVREGAQLHTRALYVGEVKTAFRKAADISRQVHIKSVNRRYKRVVAILDDHYDEMWVGGKASYKLGGIIDEGGELVIYAPHLKQISETHGEVIRRFGYHPLNRVKELVAGSEELRNNLCVAAHLAHVSYANSKLHPDSNSAKYKITLATGVSAQDCATVNLGFSDHRDLPLEDMASDPDTLVVENAGRDLYLYGDQTES